MLSTESVGRPCETARNYRRHVHCTAPHGPRQGHLQAQIAGFIARLHGPTISANERGAILEALGEVLLRDLFGQAPHRVRSSEGGA